MIDPTINLWLNGNVPSSKNSKRIVRGRGRRPRLLWSKLAEEYRDTVKHEMLAERLHWDLLVRDHPDPIVCAFYFVRSSRRRFDFHNAVQTISDLMVEAQWLSDDDMDHFIPVPLQINGKWYHVDKDAPGVLIQPGTV